MGVNVLTTFGEGVATYFFLSVAFVMTSLAFVPIGQVCGRLMKRRPNLRAYGLNLLGSLVGVALTFIVSFLWTPPMVWFGISFAVILLLHVRRAMSFSVAALRRRRRADDPGVARQPAVAQGLLAVPDARARAHSAGLHGDSRRRALLPAGLQLSPTGTRSTPRCCASATTTTCRTASTARRPMSRSSAPAPATTWPRRCGRGRSSSTPSRSIRRSSPPAGPITPSTRTDQPQVRPIVNDARTFLRTRDWQYDLVVYGLLDSHTLLSHASSVRLDSFVYTVEGFRDARSRLKDDGVSWRCRSR